MRSAGAERNSGLSLPFGSRLYAFPNVTGTGIESKELADLLLAEAGVACLNGGSFGTHGDGYIRFSYANSLEKPARGRGADQTDDAATARLAVATFELLSVGERHTTDCDGGGIALHGGTSTSGGTGCRTA
jgi:hypothetical protein